MKQITFVSKIKALGRLDAEDPELFKLVLSVATGIVSKITLNDPEQTAMDAVVKIYQSNNAFNLEPSTLYSFIVRVSKNTAIDSYRNYRRHFEIPFSALEDCDGHSYIDQIADSDALISTSIANRELIKHHFEELIRQNNLHTIVDQLGLHKKDFGKSTISGKEFLNVIMDKLGSYYTTMEIDNFRSHFESIQSISIDRIYNKIYYEHRKKKGLENDL